MLNEPTKELVKVRVPKQTIKHDGNQVLSWCANNVEVKEDAGGRWRPMKPEQQPNCKIDGITALIMAIGLYLRDERRETPTFDANCFVY